jgi:hypothetical protein
MYAAEVKREELQTYRRGYQVPVLDKERKRKVTP